MSAQLRWIVRLKKKGRGHTFRFFDAFETRAAALDKCEHLRETYGRSGERFRVFDSTSTEENYTGERAL
jgi:hypothetical protein